MNAKRNRLLKALIGNALLSLCSILLVLGSAELITRLTWTEYTHGLYQVAPDGLRLTANTEGSYRSAEFEFTVTSNRFGRRDWEWTEAVMKDPCNIVFIGDSFVFGYGVNEVETVPSLIESLSEEKATMMEVFNFGLGGGFPEYRSLTREAINIGIRARTIAIGLFLGNDFTEMPVYTRVQPVRASSAIPWRAPRVTDSALYRFLKARIGASAALTGLLFKASRWLDHDIYPTSAGYIFLRGWTKDQEKLFYSFLDQSLDIARIARDHQRNVVFVIFPNRIQVENSSDLTSSVFDADLPNQRIRAYCAKHELWCLDLLPALRDDYTLRGRPLYFPIDRHLNSSGNRIAAKQVVEYLRGKEAVCQR